jgi:hypothetical protein
MNDLRNYPIYNLGEKWRSVITNICTIWEPQTEMSGDFCTVTMSMNLCNGTFLCVTFMFVFRLRLKSYFRKDTDLTFRLSMIGWIRFGVF